jgi:putative membrane protein
MPADISATLNIRENRITIRFPSGIMVRKMTFTVKFQYNTNIFPKSHKKKRLSKSLAGRLNTIRLPASPKPRPKKVRRSPARMVSPFASPGVYVYYNMANTRPFDPQWRRNVSTWEYMHSAWWGGMILGLLTAVSLVLLLVLALLLFRCFAVRGGGIFRPESSLDILKRRYARGEITAEEYERMKHFLKG